MYTGTTHAALDHAQTHHSSPECVHAAHLAPPRVTEFHPDRHKVHTKSQIHPSCADSCPSAESSGAAEKLFERLPELEIEDGVDDWVGEAVHVADPGGEEEGHQAGAAVGALLHADGVHDVTGEERHPARQKHTCQPATSSITRSEVQVTS